MALSALSLWHGQQPHASNDSLPTSDVTAAAYRASQFLCTRICAGYVAPGDKFKDQPAIELQVMSELVSSKPSW
jgi:hypothetical protein